MFICRYSFNLDAIVQHTIHSIVTRNISHRCVNLPLLELRLANTLLLTGPSLFVGGLCGRENKGGGVKTAGRGVVITAVVVVVVVVVVVIVVVGKVSAVAGL